MRRVLIPGIILLVSLAVIAFVVQFCLLPPRRMEGYRLGDDKCDVCGEPAVYDLIIERRFLHGEFCRTHRWMGVVNAGPMTTVMKVLLGGAAFGVVYAVLALLGKTGRQAEGERQEREEEEIYDERLFARQKSGPEASSEAGPEARSAAGFDTGSDL
jgi:hypothetical protein